MTARDERGAWELGGGKVEFGEKYEIELYKDRLKKLTNM
jgi:hypothetical protein